MADDTDMKTDFELYRPLLALLLAGCAARAGERQRGFCFGFRVRRTAGKRGVRHADARAVMFADALGRTVTVESQSAWRRSSALCRRVVPGQAGRTRLLRRRTTPDAV
ncbi:MAG: hypothetical protein ACLRRT_01975 [Ruthenibacterium lactatiformans]